MSETKHTPGPWNWSVNPQCKSISLESHQWVVMAFERWGMSGATPLFAGTNRNLTRAVDFGAAIPGREHHSHWAVALNHPDANLIAAAPDLLAACKAMMECEDAHASGIIAPDFEDEAVKLTRDAIAKAEGLVVKVPSNT